jgi:hypothetical protein
MPSRVDGARRVQEIARMSDARVHRSDNLLVRDAGHSVRSVHRVTINSKTSSWLEEPGCRAREFCMYLLQRKSLCKTKI